MAFRLVLGLQNHSVLSHPGEDCDGGTGIERKEVAWRGTAASLGVRVPERYFRVCYLTRGERVAWIVRLVQIGDDGDEPFADVMTINRPDGLDDIANLGLTVADGKQVLAGLQQEIVAAQTRSHSVRRPECRGCSGVCQLKDYRNPCARDAFWPGHGASSPFSLYWVWRDRGWRWLAIALPVDAGIRRASSAFFSPESYRVALRAEASLSD
jgi:hypothetical protein